MTNIAKSCLVLTISVFCLGCNQAADDATSGDDSPTSQSSATADNANCPIMGGEVTAEGGTVSWNGQTIGFCCEGCSEKWAALSDEEKAEALAETNLETDPEGTDSSDSSADESSAS
ncbi:MAG: hypothetical protein AB7V46_24485 [Thermomicrobiales bacterium]